MSNVSTWSQTAASNSSASPNGWPEAMAPSGVNDSARENMAALAKWYACLNGSLTTTGSADAYVLTTGSSHATLAAIGALVFKASFTNAGTCTLAVDGLTAKNIYWNGAALIAGSIVSGNMYALVYNPTGDVFELITNPVDLPSLKSRGITYPTSDGTNGQFMVTNGSGALSFASVSNSLTRIARTSDTILAAGNLGAFIDVTSGTFTQTVTAAATLGAGWYCYYRNSGTGVVTIDPDSSETINGAATLVVYPETDLIIQSDGSNFYTPVLNVPHRNHLGTIVPTASGVIDFLSIFSSTYDDYDIEVDDINFASTTEQIYMRFGNAGSADSGSNYINKVNGTPAAATTVINLSGSIASGGTGFSARIRVIGANNTTQSKRLFSWGSSTNTGPAIAFQDLQTVYFASNAASGFSFVGSSAGDFAASTGEVRVFGIVPV